MMIINVSEKMSGKRKQSTLSQSSESESEPETQQKKSKLGNLRYLYVFCMVSWWILPALYYEKHGERERGKKKRFRGRGLPFPPPPADGAGFIPPAPSFCEEEKMYLKGGGGGWSKCTICTPFFTGKKCRFFMLSFVINQVYNYFYGSSSEYSFKTTTGTKITENFRQNINF